MFKYFPLYMNLENKKIVFIGAGNIALRRLKSLILFNTNIKIVAKKCNIELKKILEDKKNNIAKIKFEEREFEEKDLEDIDIVFICTNDKNLNKKISNLAKEKNLMYNNASDRFSSNFYFPSVILEDDICIALASEKDKHRYTKETRCLIEEKLGMNNKIKYR